MKKIALHWKIIAGLLLGVLWGLISSYFGWSKFNTDWIKPFGTIFINLLKLIAVPLVLFSLISGVSSLKDLSKRSRMGGKTVVLYLSTTFIAICIGLTLVNIIQPGNFFSAEKREEFRQLYAAKAMENIETAGNVKNAGPLQTLIDFVPSNIFSAMADNSLMLQVIFSAILFGIAMISIPESKTRTIKDFIHGTNEVTLRMVDIIMLAAPYGVFALMASMITNFAGDDPSSVVYLFQALRMYTLTVVLGFVILIFLVYPSMLRFFTKVKMRDFYKGILPAQTLAFSSSSSAATFGINPEGLALIFSIDGILDMCRTMVNVTSDATVASVINASDI